MHDKGYAHPLYSLDLLDEAAEPEDDARYALPGPAGRLVVRRPLRRRGKDTPSQICAAAVNEILALRDSQDALLGPYGLDATWADNMRHWSERMWDLEHRRGRAIAEERWQRQVQAALVTQGRRLWDRLALSARLAGLGETVVRGAPPRGFLDFCEALDLAAGRADEHAALLARFGFPDEARGGLAEVRGGLRASRSGRLLLSRQSREATDQLFVVRGALLGDVARLSEVAGRVLLPQLAQRVEMGRLLARGAPREEPAPPLPPR